MNYLKKLFCGKLKEENQKLKESHSLATEFANDDDKLINSLKAEIEILKDIQEEIEEELEEYKNLQGIYPLSRIQLSQHEGYEVSYTAIYRGQFENGMKVFKSITDCEFEVCESILIRQEHITLECEEYDIVTLTGTVVKFQKRIRGDFVDDWTLENATAVAKY